MIRKYKIKDKNLKKLKKYINTKLKKDGSVNWKIQ